MSRCRRMAFVTAKYKGSACRMVGQPAVGPNDLLVTNHGPLRVACSSAPWDSPAWEGARGPMRYSSLTHLPTQVCQGFPAIPPVRVGSATMAARVRFHVRSGIRQGQNGGSPVFS
jgi:hypothetical protein